jgi:acyl-CoA hydrolase
MENYKLVLPEHLNHYGFLFGGNLLKWVDETAWIAASFDYAGCNFVTIAMDKVEFRKSVRQGTILRINAERGRVGNTSVQYAVTVSAGNIETGAAETIFSTNITFVCIDAEGRKTGLPTV